MDKWPFVPWSLGLALLILAAVFGLLVYGTRAYQKDAEGSGL